MTDEPPASSPLFRHLRGGRGLFGLRSRFNPECRENPYVDTKKSFGEMAEDFPE